MSAGTPASTASGLSWLDVTAGTPGTNLLRDMEREACQMNKLHAVLVSEMDMLDSLAPEAAKGLCDNGLSAVKKLQRTNPMLWRLDDEQLAALVDGAEVQVLRLGDVEHEGTSNASALSGVSLLLSGSMRAQYSPDWSCCPHTLRHVLTPGDVVSGRKLVSSSPALRGGRALMAVQLRWNVPFALTALTPCRILRVSHARAAQVLFPAVADEIARQAATLQALPLFSWMGMGDVQDFLELTWLQLVGHGSLLAAVGDAPSDTSLLHIVMSGNVSSAVPFETTLPSASRGWSDNQDDQSPPRRAKCSMVRVQGTGAHVGFAGLALGCASRSTVRAINSCLVLSFQHRSVRSTCFTNERQALLASLEAASGEAARQEDVLAGVCSKIVPALWHLGVELTGLLSHLALLVGHDGSSFETVLSAPGHGCLPPRNLEVLFGGARKLQCIARQLLNVLDEVFVNHVPPQDPQAQTRVIELHLETVVARVLELVGSMARNTIAPLASNALRAVAELTWLQADEGVSGRIKAQEQACAKSLLDLMCAPLCFWPRQVELAQGVHDSLTHCLEDLPHSSRNSEWVRAALNQDGITLLHDTAELCNQAQHDVGGFLDTLVEVSHLASATPAQQATEECGVIGMQMLAPVPGQVYTNTAAGLHHRVLLSVSGEMLPAAARVNDVGLASGRQCRVLMLNALLLVSLDALDAASPAALVQRAIGPAGAALWQHMACSGWHSAADNEGSSATSTIFYLPATLLVRIR